MFWLKACPRCRGDIYLESNELEGNELHCMQCGFRRFVTQAATLGEVKNQEQSVIPRAA